MTEDSVEGRFRQIVSKVFKKTPEEIKLESRFREDLGADSLDLIVLLHEVEDKFDVEIPDAEVPKLQTIGDAIRYISETQAAGPGG